MLRSETGLNQLAALKTARDAVNLRPNNPNDTYFLLVGIGSQHSLIKSMVIGSSQAFYGSDHLVFPLLSGEYLIWQAGQMKDKTKVPSAEAIRRGFTILGG